MKVKKSFFNIIIWVLYSVILFTSICVGAIGVAQAENMSSFLIPLAISFGICVAAFAVLIYGYKFLAKFNAEKNKGKEGESFSINGALEIFILCMLVVISVAIRFVKVISFGDVFETPSLIYEYVNATSTATMPTVSNGAFVYADIIKFVMQFLGFKVSIALFCQVFFQIVGIFLCFFAMKNYYGHLAAWISALLMALLPGSISAVEVIEPDFFILDLILIFMICLGKLVKACERNKIRENWHIAFYIGLGVLGGAIAYLDIIGLLLLFIGVWYLYSNEIEDKWINVQKFWYQALFFGGAFAITFVFMVMKLSVNSLTGTEALAGYFKAFIPQNGLNLSILSPNYGNKDFVVMLALGGLWLFEFLRSENDKAFPFTLFIAVSTIFTFFTFDCSSYSFMNSVFWMCMSGIGVVSLTEFNLKAGEEELNEQRKNKKEMKRRAKETKNALERGEKAISLAATSGEIKTQSAPVFNANGRKSYGIGRKTEDIVSDVNIIPETPETHEINAGLKAIEVSTEVKEPQKEESKVDVSENVSTSFEQNDAIESSPVKEEIKEVSNLIPNDDLDDEEDDDVIVVPRADIPVREYKEPIAIGYGSFRRQEAQRQESGMQDNASGNSELNTNNDLNESTAGLSDSADSAARNSTGDNSGNTVRYAKLGNKRGKMFTPVRKATDPVSNANDLNNLNNTNVRAVTHGASSMDVRPVSVPPAAPAVNVSPVSNTSVAAITSAFEERTVSTASQPVTLGVGFQNSYSQKASAFSSADNNASVLENETNNIVNTNNTSDEFGFKKITRPIAGKEDEKEPVLPVKEDKTASDKKESTYAKKTWSINNGSNMIKNPLPTPKPHVSKELDYDYIPTPAEMKFDIEDLQGREYFDI